nr:MAG TPA: hypothetical protein [Caudoviricetes sp.]
MNTGNNLHPPGARKRRKYRYSLRIISYLTSRLST